MDTYRIYNTESGQDLGQYQGETESDAIQSMLDDAGCTDEPSDDLVAELVEGEE